MQFNTINCNLFIRLCSFSGSLFFFRFRAWFQIGIKLEICCVHFYFFCHSWSGGLMALVRLIDCTLAATPGHIMPIALSMHLMIFHDSVGRIKPLRFQRDKPIRGFPIWCSQILHRESVGMAQSEKELCYRKQSREIEIHLSIIEVFRNRTCNKRHTVSSSSPSFSRPFVTLT